MCPRCVCRPRCRAQHDPLSSSSHDGADDARRLNLQRSVVLQLRGWGICTLNCVPAAVDCRMRVPVENSSSNAERYRFLDIRGLDRRGVYPSMQNAYRCALDAGKQNILTQAQMAKLAIGDKLQDPSINPLLYSCTQSQRH